MLWPSDRRSQAGHTGGAPAWQSRKGALHRRHFQPHDHTSNKTPSSDKLINICERSAACNHLPGRRLQGVPICRLPSFPLDVGPCFPDLLWGFFWEVPGCRHPTVSHYSGHGVMGCLELSAGTERQRGGSSQLGPWDQILKPRG